ncbi:MAG: NUDIX domain-containing protein [Bacteroidota bacterium]
MSKSSTFPDKIINELSIDCVIVGFTQDGLQILLVEHAEGISKGKWALPGGWIKYNEGLDNAAHRILRDLTGVEEIFLEQLKAFGSLDRYPTNRVITIAYYSLVRPDAYNINPGFTASDAKWYNLSEIEKLPYDHQQIVDFCKQQLKYKVRHEPIGFNLLPEKFTLFQLQSLYESILETTLDKPNFRRKIMKMNLLVDCQEKQKDVAHRAANLYRFDLEVYRQLQQRGYTFEF